MTVENLLKMLENCEHNDDTPGYFVDMRNPNNIIPSYCHAYIILKRELINHTYIISESGTPELDVIKSIEDITDTCQITDNMIKIIGNYLESINVNNNRQLLEKILVKTENIKLKNLLVSFML